MTTAGSTARSAGTSTRLRITRRGRVVLSTLASLPIAAGAALAILAGGSAAGSADQGMSLESFPSVTVLAGDSLWSIAERIDPTADPRDVIAEITALNQIGGESVHAGQTLFLPAVYGN
ncbi:LysM peptidoglycan-binding domain-containing protein [Microbacterium amylolyticum]|uniref:LysM domain-containing protein n=1 Tax=Microbacterium amylolyticum TaxID=936337 RepID=A0ABS4ZGJ2_9MICO|nr:LysM peptidoglycan-binding domain-containing protein [Microbacterium amylolyticum]MBP2436133.1 hypothetical protein [Microbacterium amylolyticum]